MAEFYYKRYVSNYEIDLVNDLTEEEKIYLESKHIELGYYYRAGNGWNRRVSGNTYKIDLMPYYKELKKYLDYRFKKFTRIKKLKKLNEQI